MGSGLKDEKTHSPRLANRTRALRRRQTRDTGMNERRALALLVYPLEVDNKAARIMLREREDLGAKEGHDVVGDDVVRFGLEVGVVDAEAVVEPVDFVGDEVAGDEALDDGEIRDQRDGWR